MIEVAPALPQLSALKIHNNKLVIILTLVRTSRRREKLRITTLIFLV